MDWQPIDSAPRDGTVRTAAASLHATSGSESGIPDRKAPPASHSEQHET